MVSEPLRGLVRSGGGGVSLGSSAVEAPGLLRDTDACGPAAHMERWCQGSVGRERAIPQSDWGRRCWFGVCLGVVSEAEDSGAEGNSSVHQSIEESVLSFDVPHRKQTYWTSTLTVGTE